MLDIFQQSADDYNSEIENDMELPKCSMDNHDEHKDKLSIIRFDFSKY